MADEKLAVCPNCLHVMVMQSPDVDACPNCGEEVEYDMNYDTFDCPECGEEVPEIQLEMHGGVCKVCHDDNHFGDEEE